MKNQETILQNQIKRYLIINNIAVVFRANVGKIKIDDKRYFSTGLPAGFTDLFGYRLKDGKMFFMEVKTDKGRLTDNQKKFIEEHKANNIIIGVVRSINDALELLGEQKLEGVIYN